MYRLDVIATNEPSSSLKTNGPKISNNVTPHQTRPTRRKLWSDMLTGKEWRMVDVLNLVTLVLLPFLYFMVYELDGFFQYLVYL